MGSVITDLPIRKTVAAHRQWSGNFLLIEGNHQGFDSMQLRGSVWTLTKRFYVVYLSIHGGVYSYFCGLGECQ